jgi:hypothetical protein
MRIALTVALLTPSLAFAAPASLKQVAQIESQLAIAQLRHDATAERAALNAAALIPWPLLDSSVDATLAAQRALLDGASRRSWALDRALPMLAGEIKVADDVLDAVLSEVAAEVKLGAHRTDTDMSRLQAARNAYAARDLAQAEARYGEVTQRSPLWPDALRERAWTLLQLGRPNDALGATVSLGAPYFPPEDHAEARLMKATVLLRRCRFAEAREVVAALADAPIPALDAAAALAALQSGTAPNGVIETHAWTSPLVARVRAVLATVPDDHDPDTVVQLRRQAVVKLGLRLFSDAFTAEAEATRAIRERALRIRYETLRSERGILEHGAVLREPSAAPPELLDDDEVAWRFDGIFWRDELGSFRYSAGDACPHESRP